MANRQTEKDIRESLMEQLRNKGAEVAHFIDLVDQYMYCCKLVRKLRADINSKGVKYEETSSVGVKRKIQNPSIKDLVGVLREMENLLRNMGLTTDSVTLPEDDEL